MIWKTWRGRSAVGLLWATGQAILLRTRSQDNTLAAGNGNRYRCEPLESAICRDGMASSVLSYSSMNLYAPGESSARAHTVAPGVTKQFVQSGKAIQSMVRWGHWHHKANICLVWTLDRRKAPDLRTAPVTQDDTACNSRQCRGNRTE